MTDLWAGTELEEVEAHLNNDKTAGEFSMSNERWEQMGFPMSGATMELMGRRWFVQGYTRTANRERVILKVRRQL